MVGRGGNSRNWLSPLFMLIHYSMANMIIRYKFKELWQGRK